MKAKNRVPKAMQYFLPCSILRTLEERIVERESHPGTEQNKEKNAWEEFWKEWGPKLFIYACSNGSVDAVKFFYELGLENGDGSLLKNAWYGYTKLQC